MSNSNSKAGTEFPQSTEADVTKPSQTIAKPNVIRIFFEGLGFYENSPNMYKLVLPTKGTYIISDPYGSLWMEYDEEHGEAYKQSVGVGKFNQSQITALVGLLQNCV